MKAAEPKAASPNGTTIPLATQITDRSGDIWTLSAGVVYENRAPAGYSKSVTLLVYDNDTVYQENWKREWFSWNGSTWVSSNGPSKASSQNGTTVPLARQITDGSGNIWSLSAGVIYENGMPAGQSESVTLLVYDNNTIYQENWAREWWCWNGSAWVSSSDPRNTPSPNGATIPSVTQIIDGNGNIWTVSGGVVYENGASAGYSKSVTLLVYDSNTIYQENSAGGWWSWNGSTWMSSDDPPELPAGGSVKLSWTAPTQNTNGTPLTDLAGYTIYYGTSPSELTHTIRLADPSSTGYQVSNLSAGTYYFAVAAFTTAGTQSEQSSMVSKAIQ